MVSWAGVQGGESQTFQVLSTPWMEDVDKD